ncbi:MAG TPA: hypothetical protein VM661_08585 [Candidatus Sulfotelmatobacter sp.]|jgi:hypothetical protein|nr:hypothetical protein [Candidatus Sulfotelmatobacter sp.]
MQQFLGRGSVLDDFRDMDRLSLLLEAEYNGHPFDPSEAHQLASRISRSYPDVARTLNLMMERHRDKRN